MKKIILLLTIFLLAANAGFGQIMFERHYGGDQSDQGLCIQQTADSGYIITGGTFSYGNGSSDVYLIKTDKYGNVLWSKTYGGGSWDIGICVIQTSDGGYILSGYTSSFGAGSSDVYIVRTNQVGDTIWTKTFGGLQDESGTSIIGNADGSFIIVGSTSTYTSSFSSAYLLKIDGNGSLIWSKSYDKLGSSRASSIVANYNNGYIIGGTTGDTPSMLYLLKINNNGDTIWTKSYSWPDGNIDGASVILSLDYRYIMSGNIKYPNGEYDLCLLKTDTNGIAVWFNNYGGTGSQGGGKACLTSDGDVIMTGKNDTGLKTCKHENIFDGLMMFDNIMQTKASGVLFLMKVDVNGDSLWSQDFGGNDYSYGNCVYLANDNGFIICGGITIGTDHNVYLIKTNEFGISDVNESSYNKNFLIYPIPCNGKFIIKQNNVSNEICFLKIFNSTGKMIMSRSFGPENEQNFDLSNYSTGIYLLQIIKNNKVFTSKLIIQK
ncbi:MAG: T9SS type A sorting domain-containing protein [Bacteroidota bacterium]